MDQKRYAFLMGANGPQSVSFSSLKYAERDAERLAVALKAPPCAFTNVEWMTAVSRETTLMQLQDFAEQCKPSDLLIVHFSGHGIYDRQLYLICNSTKTKHLNASAIDGGSLKSILEGCKARHKVLVLDCCYAGGAFSGIFKGEQDIKGVLSKELEGAASIILSACSRFDRARELETLDGGAGFLSWVLVASCATRFRDVSPDRSSLTLGDIWRWMPTALAEVNSLLGETNRLPSPILDSHLEAGADLEQICLTDARREPTGNSSYQKPQLDRERFLKALLADHSSFMRDRLNSFVGRIQELEEIRQRIAKKQQTGGYVTITGQAGQGKSSIIAKLVEEYGLENVAFHFIPFNPGPDHQVGLLRNLMTRLILKYDLLDLYVASDSRPALRDFFPKVLEELAAKGGREVILIDGLDQLEAETSGERDLSFLPDNPPTGVVFVLGTRPNDTLRPLKLLKPHNEYELPNLSREDFDLILGHRHLQLDKGLVDQLHQAMQGNALFLDLLAKELVERGTSSPEALIKQLAHNPEHLFSLTIARLKRQPIEWREVIKPVLGVLLVAREPLGLRHIRQIIGVDDDRLRDGIERLGGLVTRDWQQRYSLFHLKLYEYLRQDEGRPTKEYIFATDEEQGWHKRFAQWCEGRDVSALWRDGKYDGTEQRHREYARQHYLAHLYSAQEWQQLFKVLDTVEYGKAKIQDDPSTRAYADDLKLGQQAATWEGWTVEEGIALLPRLWQYILLRSSLASRADQYPLVAFRLLVLLKREQEALELAELLTVPANKVRALLQIAEQIRGQLNQEREWQALLFRAREIARTIEDSYQRAEALRELGTALAQAQQWEQAQSIWREAQTIISAIKDSSIRVWALGNLATALAQAQQREQAQSIWKEARAVIDTIEPNRARAEALGSLGIALAQAQQWEQAQLVIDAIADSMVQAETLRNLAPTLVQAQQWEQVQAMWRETQAAIGTIEHNHQRAEALKKLAPPLVKTQQWEQVQTLWRKTQAVIGTTESNRARTEALGSLGIALAQAQQWEQAQAMWREIQAVIGTIEHSHAQAEALRNLATALIQAQQWQQAQVIIASIEHSRVRAEALRNLAIALIQAQRWQQAQVIIASIEHSIVQAGALRNLATALAQAQQWEQAQVIIDIIADSIMRAEALRNLTTALAQAQQWEQAQVVIDTIEHSVVRAEALRNLATALAQAQQWEQAQATIASIEHSVVRAAALRNLATTLAQAQQWEQAQTMWRETQVVIGTIEHSVVRAEALRNLAIALNQAQQWEQAQLVIASIENSYWRAEALKDLRTTLNQAQQWEQAQLVIASIENSYWRAEVLRGLAAALAQSSEQEQLLRLIQQSWLRVSTREEALKLFPLVTELIPRNPELGLALYKAFTWVDTCLKG